MADKLKFNLRHCYGIGKLEGELEFKHKGHAIYAPNGVMKTSFARTMIDLSKGEEPKDLAFPDRDSVFEVTLNDEPILKEEIFVVESYNANYLSKEISTLLANHDLKAEYEDVHKEIGKTKNDLDKKLRGFAKLRPRENLDPIIENLFKKKYYEALSELKEELDNTEISDLSEINFNTIFNEKVVNFLSDKGVLSSIDDFAKKYNELTQKSPILKKEFQFHNVNKVQQELEKNKFFTAGHSINLLNKETNEKSEFDTTDALREIIEGEKKRVLNDNELKDKFDSFNSKIKNKELETFRDYITENQNLLLELQNLDILKRKLWIQYLLKARTEYDDLMTKYLEGQARLSEIVKKANSGNAVGDWHKVIEQFNARFLHLPFSLYIGNQSDVVLKDSAPSIEFQFKDGADEKTYKSTEREALLRILSTGEARALYILNIMFEVYTRWKSRKKTLFIFDDIADSFDYKNKFAIIDYLKSITEGGDNNFLIIILTHNFDFLRTIDSRGVVLSSQCSMAFKNKGHIELSKFDRSTIRNPFEIWKKKLSDMNLLVAYIPLLRNIIEYTQGTKDNEDYMILTRMIHFKDKTSALCVKDYKAVFEKVVPNAHFPSIDENQNMLELIFATANECLNVDDGINLEHKIVLSMAVRLWSDRYMIKKIQSENPKYELPSRSQTGRLVPQFEEMFNNSSREIQLLKRINLITPSNIHINAFMYEPILDMGFGELKALYTNARQLLV